MPKPRTKRGALREERKRKRRDETNGVTPETAQKRQRTKQAYDDDDYDEGYAATGDVDDFQHQQNNGLSEREFFGMLAEEEQEYFRRADEMLELNQFPTTEERDLFLESVFREAQGKELKLASSQSCSRLMERLIQLSSTRQKKHLFDAFGGHFLSLVRHRFASHCCEALFLRSAGLVSQELAGFVVDTRGARTSSSSSSTTAAVEQYDQHQPESSMEQLFLATLDELEGSLSFLLTDRFASHTLRVLLVVLSGRPLQEAAVKTLMRSRKKERVWVAGAVEHQQQEQQEEGLRAVPASFTAAIQKIIADSTAGLDATGLRVLAKHPVGNPTLQLLLELDMTLNKNMKKKPAAAVAVVDGEEAPPPSLLLQLLPGAPESLSDPTSEAAEFVNGMVYDQIGSRLVETLVQHCPGKIFRHLNQNFFLPRIEGYVRNDIACYPAIRVLERLGRDQLVEAVDRIVPTVPQLVSKARFNVLKTLVERCAARQITEQAKALVKAVKEACGPQPADLVTTLCRLGESQQQQQQQQQQPQPQKQPPPQQEEHQEEVQTPSRPSRPPPPFNSSSQQQQRHEYAIQSHGAALLTALLAVHGPSKAVHESLLAVPSPSLLSLATTSLPTVTLLTTALRTPCPPNAVFQKTLVARLAPHVAELATSQFGHNLVNAIAQVPCKGGKDVSVPYHVKEAVMLRLAAQEQAADKQRGLRESWMGRSVWRTWKGDMWRTRPVDWKIWAKDMSAAATPQHQHQHQHQPLQQAKGKGTAVRKDRHLVAV